MAAPTIALQDPTGLSRMGPHHWGRQDMEPFPGLFTPAKASVVQVSPGIPAVGRQAPLRDATDYSGRIPMPPMGRIYVNTFPPIYRERGSNRDVIGQLWPWRNR